MSVNLKHAVDIRPYGDRRLRCWTDRPPAQNYCAVIKLHAFGYVSSSANTSHVCIAPQYEQLHDKVSPGIGTGPTIPRRKVGPVQRDRSGRRLAAVGRGRQRVLLSAGSHGVKRLTNTMQVADGRAKVDKCLRVA